MYPRLESRERKREPLVSRFVASSPRCICGEFRTCSASLGEYTAFRNEKPGSKHPQEWGVIFILNLMTVRHQKSLLIAGLLLAALLGGALWKTLSLNEPAYGGKRLSAWLDQLCALDALHQRSQGAAQIQAVRAIGTNAIPWLLNEYRQRGSVWQWRVNQLLNQQRVVKFRFPELDHRLNRATVGFRALGELGEPAIPDLLALVESTPGYIPGALAGIGRPAVPALQQCLTNMTLYTNSLGTYAIIPGNTISDIDNAASLGSFSKSDLELFLPPIRAWALQTTNLQAQVKAQWFLNNYPQLP
jgi:hypothetical protein